MVIYSEGESKPDVARLVSLDQWDPFHTKPVLIQMFKDLCDAHPDVASYQSVGKDSGGQDIWLFKIGNPNGGRVMWDGALHGIEDFGSESIYLLTDWLLNSGDAYSTRILQGNQVLFIPSILSRFTRGNYNTAICSYGVNLNRNFKTGWSALPCSDAELYSGISALSEPESKVLSAVWNTYRPYYYVNLHEGGTSKNYYGGAQASKCTQAITLMNTIASQFGITPWSISSSGSTGFAYGDAAAIYGAGGFLIEVDPSWSHTTTTWNILVNSVFPKNKALLIAQCQLCESEDIVYETSLTLSAPSSAARGVPFTVSGYLRYIVEDLGYGLQGMTVQVRYNGTPLGSAVTDANGYYSLSIVIDAVGSFGITAEFMGYVG